MPVRQKYNILSGARNWHLLRRCAKHGAALKQWPSETATCLNFVKDAFRNPAMRPQKSFDREQAISIYDHTRAFMRMLAKQVAPARAP